MSDSTENKRNDRDGFVQENDPLQELSRLFGFDAPVVNERSATDAVQTDAIYDAGRQEPEIQPHGGDLAGELERELMAGFDDEFSDFSSEESYNELTAPAEDSSFAHFQHHEPDVEDDFFASLESELNYSPNDMAGVAPVFADSPVNQSPPSLEDELEFLLQGGEPADNIELGAAQLTPADSGVSLSDVEQPSYLEEIGYYETPALDAQIGDLSANVMSKAEYVADAIDDELYEAPEITHAPQADRSFYDEQTVPESSVDAAQLAYNEPLSTDNYYSRQNYSQFTSSSNQQATDLSADVPLVNDVEEMSYFADEVVTSDDAYYASPEDETLPNDNDGATVSSGFADIFRATSQELVSSEVEAEIVIDDSDTATEKMSVSEADWYGESLENSHYYDEQKELGDGLASADEALNGESSQLYVSEPTEQDFFSLEDFNFSLEDEVEQQTVVQKSEPSGARPFVPAPEVETVSVSEQKVEPTQTLDLPEINFEDPVSTDGLSGFEAEFSEIFSSVAIDTAVTGSEQQSAENVSSEADKAFEAILQNSASDYELSGSHTGDSAALAANIASSAAMSAAAMRYAGNQQAGSQDFAELSDWPQKRNDPRDNIANPDDYYNHWAAHGTQGADFGDYNLSEELSRNIDEEESGAEFHKDTKKKYLWASSAGLALLVIAGGYYMLGSGGVGGEPVVIRADKQSTKIQPENPGGDTVPNQDKAVYDQVAGMQPVKPQQENLIDTGERPVDVSLLHGDDEPTADRVSPMDGEELTAPVPTTQTESLIKPRTVKTMIVRADGTIIENTSAPVIAQPEIGSEANPNASVEPADRLISDEPAASAQNAAAPRVVQTQSFTAQGQDVVPVETPQTSEVAPQITAPVIPSRPAQQQVAAADTAETTIAAPAATLPAGGYYIQVASQPSAELAQKNYAALMQRYGNVIGGRGVDIKKADIAGKGTFYRVRIPAGTKSEAVALCEQFRAAGGSCFIAQ